MKNVALFGVPRSGTSWISQIFNGHPDVAFRFQPLFSYGHKSRLTELSSEEEIRGFYVEILRSRDDFALMNTEHQKNFPRFKKSVEPTHVAFKETRYLQIMENMLVRCPEIRIFGIIRNPLAVLASWVSAPKEFSADWDLGSEWRTAPCKNKNRPEEFYGFDKWKTVAENYLRLESVYPSQFKMVRYERMKAAPVKVAEELFEFCGLQMHPQVEQFIEASQTRHDADPYSVFRARSDNERWQSVLPAAILREIQAELRGSSLERFLEDAV